MEFGSKTRRCKPLVNSGRLSVHANRVVQVRELKCGRPLTQIVNKLLSAGNSNITFSAFTYQVKNACATANEWQAICSGPIDCFDLYGRLDSAVFRPPQRNPPHRLHDVEHLGIGARDLLNGRNRCLHKCDISSILCGLCDQYQRFFFKLVQPGPAIVQNLDKAV